MGEEASTSRILRMAEEGLRSWLSSLEEPEEAQARVLEKLLPSYARTSYGREHGLEPDMDIEEYKASVPPRPYEGFRPYIARVLGGDIGALLIEEPMFFGVTSGTTGPPKLIPITEADARTRISVMAKGMARYASYWGDPDVFGAACLAPCLPSRLGEVRIGERAVPYGYISGIYVELISRFTGLSLEAYMEKVNEIGPGTRKNDWEGRFRALLDLLEGLEVRSAMGAAPALWMFARWLRRREKAWPGEKWRIGMVLCAGVPHIWESYAGDLSRMYGGVLMEAYGATEGMFALRLDEEPYLVPFYDTYLFEVRVGKEVKMLYEMRAGEVGSLVISTPIFPRYEIRDLVVCYADGLYFRIPGRDRLRTRMWLSLSRFLRGLASSF